MWLRPLRYTHISRKKVCSQAYSTGNLSLKCERKLLKRKIMMKQVAFGCECSLELMAPLRMGIRRTLKRGGRGR